MRYLDTNVSRWFRDELAEITVAVLRDEGTMSKGALIVAVMRRRGLKTNQSNIRMRAHLDEMERRGVLVSQRLLTEHHPIMVSIAETAEVKDNSRVVLPEDALVPLRHAEDRKDELLDGFFGELIGGLVVRMNEIVENLAMLNEASAVLMRESSVMREGIAMIVESMNGGFIRAGQASAERHEEVLRVLSAIREGIVSGDAGTKSYDAILVTLEDLSRKLNEPDDVVKRLGASHAMLRDLLAERGSGAVNHSVGNASGG